MSRRARIAFVVVVAAMAVLPLGIIGYNELKLATGDEIRLKVQPVDPLDFFRGEYVALTYAIARAQVPDGLGPGSTVYVPLRQENDVWTGSTAVIQKPGDATTYIRGRYTGGSIEFGIETFYVEEGQARRYERAMAEGTLYADVVLDDDGGARLDDLVIRPE